ncbi:MAG: zinc-ribbon domain-containing protein [Dehalococcoidales bacterium]
MTIFIALLLTVLTFSFIAYPLFRRRLVSAVSPDDEKYRELSSKRGTTYSMLKELEFDYQSGILTEEDYKDLEVRYKKKAIAILKDADGLEKGTEVGEEIEKQVQALRRGKSSQSKTDRQPGGASERTFCTQCGSRAQENDKFCASCGAGLSAGGNSG